MGGSGLFLLPRMSTGAKLPMYRLRHLSRTRRHPLALQTRLVYTFRPMSHRSHVLGFTFVPSSRPHPPARRSLPPFPHMSETVTTNI